MDYGLGSREFGRMTPKEFAALLDRSAENEVSRDKISWRHTAHLLAMLATTATHQAHDPDEFDPYFEEPKEKPATVKELLAFIAELNRTMGGVDLRGRKN